MLRSIEELHGYTIHATDGDIGAVHAFFFDDKTWAIRYLVVDTGVWLPDRRVLISPIALGQPDWEGQFFPVKLTTEQVRNSPDIDTDKPVSRQQETLLHTYYDWPTYWTGGIPLGPHAAAAYPGGLVMTEPYELPQEEQGDPHLHSSRDVLSYYIQARDGQIGHVEDFIVDTDAWAIRYMAVDTVNWWPGKKVLVAVTWIEYVDWAEALVHVDLSRDQVKGSPEFDATAPVNRDYESRLYDYYGRPAYWP
jgi:hypothetical protein